MIPKEKAKELVSLMLQHQSLEIEGHISERQLFENAKQCALICVDEMLDCNTTSVYWEEDFEYWKQVRQEIEKL